MRAIWVILLLINMHAIHAQAPYYRLFTMRDGLSQMKITALHIDRRGYLWIGTRNGLNKFDGEKFTVYTEADGLPHNRIHALDEDADGNIVILTYNGLSIFDGSKFAFYPKPFTSVLFDLAVDRDNTIWICEKYSTPTLYKFVNGVYKTIAEKKVSLHFQYNKKTDEKYLTAEGAIYLIKNDSLHLITKAGYFFYPASGDLNNNPFFVKEQKPGDKGRQFYYIEDGINVPVATNNENATILSIKDLKKNSIWNCIRNQLDLPDNGNGRSVLKNEFPITNDVVKDAHNQYWIGSENGLGQVYNPAFTSVSMSELSNVWTVLEDKDKNVWFATYGNGMYKLPGHADKVIKHTGARSQYYFAGSAMDKSGKLYFGTNAGLEIINGNQSKIVWNDKTVFSLYYDSTNDRIVFGTHEGVGILQNEKISFYGKQQGMHDNYYIQSIGQDKNGDYWLGSYSGLSKLNIKNGKINNYTTKNGTLPCQGVYCSLKDKDGDLWLGGDRGLMYYDHKTDSIKLLHSSVLTSMVKAMIALNGKELLLATKDGLYIFDIEKYKKQGYLQFNILNATNGYLGIDPGFMGLYQDSKKGVWICSSTTLNYLDPQKLSLVNHQLKTQVTHVNGMRLPFNHRDTILKIPYGEANVVIKFEGIEFTRPTTTQYQYKLNGGNWTSWQNDNEAILKDLKSGEYIFEVRAGPVDENPGSAYSDVIRFTIQLPFYKSAWFPPIAIGLSILLLLVSAVYFIRQRNAQKRYKAQLEEAKNLRSQLLLSQLNPHFIFNVLANIQNKVLFDKKEEASEGIVNLSKLLRNFLNASYKGSHLSTSEVENEIPLSTEIDLLRSYIEFEQSKNDHHFEYHIIHPGGAFIENYSIPPLLLQPFVENAIKHGLLLQENKGNLWLKFSESNGNLNCIIEDDGVGIEFAQQIQKGPFITHESLGSKIVKERVALLNELGYNIEISILNRDPKGTIIKIIFKE